MLQESGVSGVGAPGVHCSGSAVLQESVLQESVPQEYRAPRVSAPGVSAPGVQCSKSQCSERQCSRTQCSRRDSRTQQVPYEGTQCIFQLDNVLGAFHYLFVQCKLIGTVAGPDQNPSLAFSQMLLK